MKTLFILILLQTYQYDSSGNKDILASAEVEATVAQFQTLKECEAIRSTLMKSVGKHHYFVCLPADKAR